MFLIFGIISIFYLVMHTINFTANIYFLSYHRPMRTTLLNVHWISWPLLPLGPHHLIFTMSSSLLVHHYPPTRSFSTTLNRRISSSENPHSLFSVLCNQNKEALPSLPTLPIRPFLLPHLFRDPFFTFLRDYLQHSALRFEENTM